MKVGVNGRNDFWTKTFTENDHQAIRGAKIELLKMFSYVQLDVYRRLRDENPSIDFIVRLYDEGGHGTPEEFVNRHAPRITELRSFTYKFEILNEPNYPDWGWGPTLADAKVFNKWYVEVVDRLRERFSWIEPGFPGLSPKMLPDDPNDDLEWIQECRQAVQKSAWLGCHCYWFDEYGILHPVFGLRFIKYHELFPDKPIHITEFNGSPTGVSAWTMAEHYKRYYVKVADYPYVESASAFILSSPDSTFHSLAWWDPASGEMRPVVGAVGDIPRPLNAPPDRPIYALEYISHNTSSTMTAGQVNSARVVVRNLGAKTWQAEGYNQVRLGYHWYYTEGGLVPSSLWADLRTTLPQDLHPGEAVVLMAEVAAPRAAGNYVLKWDMVEEMVTWFAWQNVKTLDVTVKVNPGEPPPPVKMTATASHNNTLYGPDNLQQALDGNPYTRWSTLQAQRPGMWFQIDLGEVKPVAHVRLGNEASPRDYPRGYILKLSTDGQSWETVATRPDNDKELDVSFSPRPARYIRIEQTGSDSFYWWSIHQVAISDETMMSAEASHNNRRLGTDNLTQAFDGRPETRWSTMAVQTPGMWFELDLGRTQTISGFRFDNAASPNDYPRGYRVKISTDRAHWEEIAANPSNNTPLDVTFKPREVRYIHVEQTGSSDLWWWSIHEIEIKT
jgi:hypothetical protein